ncbi:MAG: DNA translocase FtsK 4TM domain-containing protein [Aestuariivirgaceae bacterium]
MSLHPSLETSDSAVPEGLRRFLRNRLLELSGLSLIGATGLAAVSLASWRADDPSFNHATDALPQNMLGWPGAAFADELMQGLGLGTIPLTVIPLAWAFTLLGHAPLDRPLRRLLSLPLASAAAASLLASFPVPDGWVLGTGLGGGIGDVIDSLTVSLMGLAMHDGVARGAACVVSAGAFIVLSCNALGIRSDDIVAWTGVFGERVESMVAAIFGLFTHTAQRSGNFLRRLFHRKRRRKPVKAAVAAAKAATAKTDAAAQREAKVVRVEPRLVDPNRRSRPALDEDDDEEAEEDSEDDEAAESDEDEEEAEEEDAADEDEEEEDEEEPPPVRKRVTKAAGPVKPSTRGRPGPRGKFEFPPMSLLAEPKHQGRAADLSDEVLQHNARMLESVLEDFGVRGEIIHVRPGPVVTLYELEPAPGIKSSRVIGLADDIARSMSAVSVRVAVVPGRNVIGIELPNAKRETVFLREMLGSEAYEKTGQALCLALGKNIGGEPIFADLARMPHLLIAGTTGSGKSVGINTMILSLLYRLTPERCRLIMIDPKMLELSVYEGIPHLLAPVVTDPRKAVVALKWAVREMEDRYRKMSKLGVRNIDGFNQRVAQAQAKGETVSRTVQTGYDELTGEPIFEKELMDLRPIPFIVVIIDEMADLMMVAGKDIEGAVQRLAQMARAAGIHVIMATQRPSVDVITGTIKANFPTRISFQVTSKIDSRTILGEQGAEQLLGQGDMLYMAGGGRIGRLHSPFVTEDEVEKIVRHLKAQGAPEYVDGVTEETEDEGGGGEGAGEGGFEGGSGDELYDQAVQVILRDKKVSTSYVQRRLQVGYNKAASLIERMEKEGIISAPNATGKREILVPGASAE